MIEIVPFMVKLDPEIYSPDSAWAGFLLCDGTKVSKLDLLFSTKQQVIEHYRSIQTTIPIRD
jgi:hypothetical protein